ncbi:MAG: DUF2071 domain-containing protein [Candidatus Sumerlaeia bacterium]|nr:DUF2071 domain-containing protein [Candidatus Sumerlaeia bacterium]
MAQSWHDLLFAHWPLPPGAIAPFVPSGLAVDTFEGHAWIAVVPFRMSGVRLRATPALPGLSAFPELNVRTYVTHRGQGGVLFFSLDAANALAVATARAWFGLPYFRARMRLRDGAGWITYASTRTHRGAPPAEFEGRYRPTGAVFHAAPGSLEHWLTERYCLFAVRRGRLIRADIHHAPWPLQPAEAEIHLNTMTSPQRIELPPEAPHLLFARRLDVAVWAPRLL